MAQEVYSFRFGCTGKPIPRNGGTGSYLGYKLLCRSQWEELQIIFLDCSLGVSELVIIIKNLGLVLNI